MDNTNWDHETFRGLDSLYITFKKDDQASFSMS